ncbi:ABC transporter [Bifidobacterium rousetti]|uniref:ABC transporter ATP-binding protein n=1 Tax=Bifidobacterium rousetti TaxID=2045439 RepID=UPI00123B31AF|nr:ABC transporter ATP-binding protein [Bifidobacterium rousetti]KAA8817992.1 ABC transporter [Bifidobacterium rousetti]
MPGPRGNAARNAAAAKDYLRMGHPWRTFTRLMGDLFSRYGVQYAVIMACILVTVLANVRGNLFIQRLIDDYIMPLVHADPGERDFGPLLGAILALAGLYAVGVVAAAVQAVLIAFVTQGFMRRLRNRMFGHMQQLPLGYFDTNSRGDVMSLYTNDIDTLRQMVSQSIPQILTSVLQIVMVLVSMIYLSVPLTGVMLVIAAVMVLLTKVLTGRSGAHFSQQQRSVGKLNGFVEEMMTGQKVVKVFTHEKAAKRDFREVNDRLYDASNKANKFAGYLGPINNQLGYIGYVVCALVGGALAMTGATGLTLGALVSFLTFVKSFTMPISQVSQQLNAIVMALAGGERVFDLLDERPESDDGRVTLVNVTRDGSGRLVESGERTDDWGWKDPSDGHITPMRGDIRLDHVNFSYVKGKEVLHDMSMFAKPGQKIALVGSTGAGKTTITNLITRFYDIDSGSITYDGIDISDMRKGDLRRSLGMVLQDTHLFSGSIMDNIRFGRLDATDEEVKAAARLANADAFIEKLPDGYDTQLTADGAALSQGQRQLLAIARAAVADPPALILDEATSSIDTRTESLVQHGMDELMRGRTTFVIAHRLSTIRNADCIMVIEAGRIIERGTHDELVAMKGRYYTLYTGLKGDAASID